MQYYHSTLRRLVVALLLVNLVVGLSVGAYSFLGHASMGLYSEGLQSDFQRFDHPGIINTELMNEHFGVESATEW